MEDFEKWIGGISSGDSVCNAAKRSLRSRLEVVRYYLQSAAERPDENIEYVHQLRVAARRCTAAVKLYAGLLPKKEVKWLRKTLRKIRRAANDARDMDVLAITHASDQDPGASGFLSDVRQRRQAAQGPIVAIYEKLTRNDRLNVRVEGLLNDTSKWKCDAVKRPFGQWATKRIQKTLQRFFKASTRDPDDLSRLHRFRIRGKELRYAMELLAPAFPSEFRDDLYPVVEQLQEHLGQINDCTVAQARYRKWASNLDGKKKLAYVRKLRKEEHDKQKKLLQDFAKWWTPEFETQLKVSFKQLVETASCKSK